MTKNHIKRFAQFFFGVSVSFFPWPDSRSAATLFDQLRSVTYAGATRDASSNGARELLTRRDTTHSRNALSAAGRSASCPSSPFS